MKIERLTAESRKNLLEDLLKRSPNQYGQYEERVQVILNRVKEEKDQALEKLQSGPDKAIRSMDDLIMQKSRQRLSK